MLLGHWLSQRSRAALVAALALSTGCVTVQAAAQSAEGELQLLSARKPIDEVIHDPRTPLRVRVLLAQIAKIKQYGEAAGLKPTENYQEYVRLERPAVVYVVTACAPLRFQPKTWSFPIAGQFPYLGWFQLGSALDLAHELEAEGLDVDVRGTTAFSTLGFFHDPVLSTMISRGPEALGDLVDVVLHESVHATLHLEGQSYFNESLASFVADHLTQRYLAETPGVLPVQREAWQAQQARSEKLSVDLHEAYVELERIYLSGDSVEVKRTRKAAYLTALRARLQWKGRLNHATLMGQRTYSSGSKGFDALYAACQGDFRCFFDRLRKLKAEDFPKQQDEEFDAILESLAAR
jgi:predicted aminopeptidase